MIRNLSFIIIFIILCIFNGNSQSGFISKWDNGFKVESEDGAFKLKFGGRIMYDFDIFRQDEILEEIFGKYTNGVEFRRLRFFNSGTVYSNLSYKLQIEFTGGGVSLKDAFIEINKIPVVGNIRVGHFKEPFRLEVLASSKYITFMERSMMSSFAQERNTGLMFLNQTKNGHLNWQLAILRNGDSTGQDTEAGDGIVIGGRLAGVIPIGADDKTELVHLGASFNHRNPKTKSYKISSRAENHLGPKYLSTGEISDVANVNLFGAEALLIKGPFSMQSEFAVVNVKRTSENAGQSYSFPAFYGEISYFLTGESRVYKKKSAFEAFDRVKPKRNFGKDGAGAWQVAIRYSTSDWNDGNIVGGNLTDITLGVNWHLNPVSRIMVNYVLADLNDDQGDIGTANIFQTRFQIDF